MTVVVLSAIVPTAIAQRWFSPDVAVENAADEARQSPAEPRPTRNPSPQESAHEPV